MFRFLARCTLRPLPPLFAALGLVTSALLLSGCFGANGGLTFNNVSPRITDLTANGRSVENGGSITASPGDTLTFTCKADDPDRDVIFIYWSPSAADARQSTPAASPTPTPTPATTSSPTPTPSPDASASPAATPTPTPTATPTPATTATPTPTPTPTATPTPAAAPSATPVPDATPTPGTDTSPIFTWQVPAANSVQYTITCTVRDERGKADSRAVIVVVGTLPTPSPSPSPSPSATPSPSS